MTGLIYPDLSYQVQGAFFDVHNALRHLGLSEEGWEKALVIALKARGVAAERQVEYVLNYKGQRVGRFFCDIIADGKILLELKTSVEPSALDLAQVIAYLKVTGLELGILTCFGGDKVEFRRLPNYISQRSAQSAWAHRPSADELLFPQLTAELRGALYEVHSALGPGFVHMHYRRAVQVELRLRELPHDLKREICIEYEGRPIETRRTRLIVVADRVLLVPIAVKPVEQMHRHRLRQYLRLLNLQLGLLANFHAPALEIHTVRI